MEIEIQREPFFILAASILLVLFGAVGYFASPRAKDGRPVLLMPDVKAVEDYRRAASGWSASWRELDGQMHGVMDAESNSELLVMSRAAQRAFERAVELARSVDSTETPAPLIGLRDQAVAASLAYMDASVAVARWCLRRRRRIAARPIARWRKRALPWPRWSRTNGSGGRRCLEKLCGSMGLMIAMAASAGQASQRYARQSLP